MSRRDTIIVAVLLNTGLLAVLFLLAVNPDDSRVTDEIDVQSTLVEQDQQRAMKMENTSGTVVVAAKSADEDFDRVFKDFAATIQSSDVNEERRSVGNTQELPREKIALLDSDSTTERASREGNANADYVEVTVKPGDILGKIAIDNGTTVKEIKKINYLQNDRLKIGQVLKVPVNTRGRSNKTSPPTVDRKIDHADRYYTVQSGDNPWKIAKKFHVSVSEFLQLNDLDETKARNLRPGDRVRVR